MPLDLNHIQAIAKKARLAILQCDSTENLVVIRRIDLEAAQTALIAIPALIKEIEELRKTSQQR